MLSDSELICQSVDFIRQEHRQHVNLKMWLGVIFSHDIVFLRTSLKQVMKME